MNVRIQTQGFDLSPALAAWAHEQLGKALHRFAEQVVAVDVYLKDMNGPKGGHDKSALVRVQLRRRAPVLIESAYDDLYAAIDLSARRCKRAVRRSLQKGQRLQRDESRRLRLIRALSAEL